MSRWIKWALGAFALLTIGIGSAMYYAASEAVAHKPPDEALPDIARNLPSDWGAANAEFRRRVMAHFPDGMSEGRLIQAMREQGFTVTAHPGAYRVAQLFQQDFPCRLDWNITWLRDRYGHATRIEASFGGGCL